MIYFFLIVEPHIKYQMNQILSQQQEGWSVQFILIDIFIKLELYK
jgi:hypothetical protein